MSSKIILPAPNSPRWGPRSTRRPEETPGWIRPYATFLNKYSRLWKGVGSIGRFRISFDAELPAGFPGDERGRTVWPWHLRLSLRVRDSLFDSRDAKSLGAFILFRQVAYAEAWQSHPFAWPVQWWRSRATEDARALVRAEELMALWAWGLAGQPNPEDQEA